MVITLYKQYYVHIIYLPLHLALFGPMLLWFLWEMISNSYHSDSTTPTSSVYSADYHNPFSVQ